MAGRALLLVVLATLWPAPAAAAQDAGRVVVVTVDGTSLADWRAPGLPAFRSILDEGAVALVSTRTSCPCANAVAERAAVYERVASLGAGPLLGEVLRRAGVTATAFGDASGVDTADRGAALAVVARDGTIETEPGRRVSLDAASLETGRADASVPGERRTDYGAVRARLDRALGWARVIVVDLGDTERADRFLHGDPSARRPWIGRALSDADRFLGELRRRLGAGDLLVVASFAPPLARGAEGVRLGVVTLAGAGTEPGLVSSASTRRAGLVTAADLGATILDRLGVDVPDDASGRVAEIVASSDGASRAARLERDLILARRSRAGVTRAWMGVTTVLIALAFLLVVAGRGRRAGREALPRRWRDLVLTALTASAAMPAAMLVAPVVARTAPDAGLVAAVIAIGATLVARLLFGREGGLFAMVASTGGLMLIDTLAGGALSLRSAIGAELAAGVRPGGASDAVLACLLAAPLLAGGLALDGQPAVQRPRFALATALVLGVAVIAAAAPTLGARAVAPLVAVPIIALLETLASGRRIDARRALGIAIAATLTGSLVALAHQLRDTPASPGLDLGSWARLTFSSTWTAGLAAAALAGAALLARRRVLVARAMWGRPHLRNTLAESALDAGILLVASATGIEAAAVIAVLAAPAFFGPFLAPD